MTAPRQRLGDLVLVAGLAALTTWLTLLSWRVLQEEWGSFAVPAFLLGGILALTGTVARWAGLPFLAVLPLQLVVAGLGLLGLVTGVPAPTPDSIAGARAAIEEAVASAQAYVAPLPRTVPSVTPLLLAGAALTFVAVDLLVGSLRRVPVAGLVLLAIYTVPVGITGSAGSWWTFAAAAAAFLALLYLQQDQVLGRWGRSTRDASDDPAGDDPSAFGVRTGAIRASAAGLGASAIALAVVLPWVVPTLELRLFDGAGGDGQISVDDPTVDLRRDLNRPDDVPMAYVTTQDPDPSYLRIAALTKFDDGYWSPGDREIPSDQLARGEMPALLGVSPSLRRQRYRYDIRTATAFDWTWLPTMAPITDIEADGDWRYDLDTMDFISADDGLTSAGTSYSMTGVELTYDTEEMDRSVSGASVVSSRFVELPGDLPSEVRSLAASITADAPSRFRKAVALQQWFRTNYEYDLSQAESAGRSYADLLAFLDEEDRRGYCEQFAASMAIMARTLDIPSRVAVGFLEPSQAATPGVWEYSSDDLHAWPELFFPGSGWVRFEPTPGDRASGIPAWTDVETEPAPSGPTSTPAPSRGQDQLPERAQPSPEAPEPDASGDGGADPVWGRFVVGGGLLVLVGALLGLLPALLRRRRRTRRLAQGPDQGAAERAWEELRDTMVDLGHGWPSGRSPRRAAQWVGSRFGAPDADPDRPRLGRDQAPEAAAALDRVVGAVERGRYAREAGTVDRAGLRADVTSVEEALHHGGSSRESRRARWWPRSVTSLRRVRRPGAVRRARAATGTSDSGAAGGAAVDEGAEVGAARETERIR